MNTPHPKLVGHFSVDTESGSYLGATRIRLLEAIERHGSITKAARAVPLSYKAAWDAIDAMNNLSEQALVTRTAGGKNGGGTTLTDYGRKIVALYRAMEQEYQHTLDRLAGKMAHLEGGDIRDFQTLLRRMSIKASARNQFAGPIVALREGAVSVEVCLRLDEANEIVALVTRESAENLGLSLGKEVHALVKASSVILLAHDHASTSARNQLWGEISHIHAGPVNAEVTMTLPGGKTIAAVITRESVENLNLCADQKACAIFEASSVTLVSWV
ncbi:molybdate transport system regulatory protein [Formivibrio citricus]|uniref:Molybdate transport system regulatory protein n=1 Tax=Formivibrio citricus TaxID=83765 RepID=A0A1I4YZN2_9NEIS|nr:TOBE domain-containing protein [Formivibrio citricus]SFN43110.1 molybdate transport system regulatory protein [Formivibrio citricus]